MSGANKGKSMILPYAKKRKSFGRELGVRFLLCLMASGLMMSVSASALAAKHKSKPAAIKSSQAAPSMPVPLSIDVGIQKVLRQSRPIRRIAIGVARIADVNIINSREILLIGKGPGTTSLLVWPAGNGAPTEYRVKVGLGDENTDEDLSSAVIAGDGISGSTSSLIAHRKAEFSAQRIQRAGAASTGTTDSASEGIGGAAATTNKLHDTSEVLLDSQVMSQIKIVEVDRTTLQEYGFNFFKNTGSVTGGLAAPATITGVQSSTGSTGDLTIVSSNGFLPIQNAFNLLLGSAKNGIFGAISILESKGLARTLAEPSLTATSGQTASFLAGGEFPVPVPQSSGGSTTPTITIQYKEFGVRLNLTPTVLAHDRIALKVAPEVSELDYTNGVSVNGFTIPGLVVRRTDTSVELGDGESFVISGLVSNTIKNSVDKVPWLGDLPFIGAFFRDTSINLADKELIMVVTPHLVHPLRKDDQLPPMPGDSIQKYKPGFARTMFLETGNFGQTLDSGYSR